MPDKNNVGDLRKLPWYTEGPVVDDVGNIFFTTLKGGAILKIDLVGNVVEWAHSTCPNGQLILPGGDHLVCETGLAAISRFNRDGLFAGFDLKGYCDGQQVYVPNDLATDASGGIYFTDSIRDQGKVCFYSVDGEQRVIAGNLDFPNGITLSRDGHLLFVAESYSNRILVIPLRSPGVTEGKWEVFAELPSNPSGEIIGNLPDGIKMDASGLLWVAHYGMGAVQVLSPDGRLINSVEIPFPLVSNLCLHSNKIIVTGGYAEPGPGGVFITELSYNKNPLAF